MVTPRTPIWLVIMTMDYCSRTFGNSPCLATGEKCFNTFPTCKYKSAYNATTKDYKFTSADSPVPFDGVRPYILDVKLLPTEIKTTLTVSGRVSVKFTDESDRDIGIDPYVTGRSAFPAIPGTFWKKWITRNRNYKGRTLAIYEGWYGEAEGSFDKRWQGRIDNVTLNKGEVTVEAVDRLKDLSKIEVPPKIDSKLNGAIDAVATSLLVTNPTNLPSSGYLIIDEEVMSYSSRDTGTGIVSGLTRGLYGTTAAAHSDKVKVGLVKVYSAQNAFDLMKSMLLTDAAMPSGEVDSTAFDTARDYFNTDDLNVQGIITEPTKLDKLYFELVDLFECKSWVAENLKVTIARNIPYDPARSLTAFSDAENILHDSASVDLNEKARLTRVVLYWEKTPAGKLEEPVSYGRVDIAVDTTAESASEYGEVLSKTIYCRWITTSGYQEEYATAFARRLVMRKVWVNRDAMPLLKAEAELKDEGMKTGDFISLTSDEMLDKFGVGYAGITFQIVRRERKGDKIAMTLQQVLPHKVGFIHDTVSPNEWASATETEKKYGYICADDATLPTDVDGYYIY